jgi:hypothetical protein
LSRHAGTQASPEPIGVGVVDAAMTAVAVAASSSNEYSVGIRNTVLAGRHFALVLM